MTSRPYQGWRLPINSTQPADPKVIRALQQDLRALGYLRAGIDGVFGRETERAVEALRYDLINNDGHSRKDDGPAPVAITSCNHGRITGVSAEVDQSLADCLAELIADSKVPKLPRSEDPAAANRRAWEALKVPSKVAPAPFIAAMIVQESGGEHYRVPTGKDADDYVVVGLDHARDAPPAQITSRGYGIGQYTIFHHPPRVEEIAEFIVDPVGNLSRAFRELREKFEGFVAGPRDHADDRRAEHPLLSLRRCRYGTSDPRYLTDCRNCALGVRRATLTAGVPVHAGSAITFGPDELYHSAYYPDLPVRAEFPCDWPYAARRYNGSGLKSYHYQARVLGNLVRGAQEA